MPGAVNQKLSCTNTSGSDPATATVNVKDKFGAQPSGALTATNCQIKENENTCDTSVEWLVINAVKGADTAVTTNYPVNNSIVSKEISGKENYEIPYGDRYFFLYHDEVELKQVKVIASCVVGTVWDGMINKCVKSEDGGSFTITLNANPTSMTLPTNSTKLIWTVTGETPDECVASGGAGWAGLVSATGGEKTITYSNFGTYTYYLDCEKGTESKTAETTVIVSPNPDDPGGGGGDGGDGGGGGGATITSSLSSVKKGMPVVLTWESDPNFSCSIIGGSTNLTDQPASGTITVNPMFTTLYELYCTNESGESVTDSVKVRIKSSWLEI